MKRVIKASTIDDVIFGSEYFDLVKRSGVGRNDTLWEGLDVISKGLAEKHVVSIRLNQKGFPEYDGEPIKLQYTDCYISHGMRSVMDTLEETEEYIQVLKAAVIFAKSVNYYLENEQ